MMNFRLIHFFKVLKIPEDLIGLEDGGFLAVYRETSDINGQYADILAQRYDLNGNKVGNEFLVNTTTDGNQEDASAASLKKRKYCYSLV